MRVSVAGVVLTNDEPRSDDELVAACLDGNTDAFAALVRKHERLLRTVAYSVTRNRHDMEDVLQEGLIKAFRNLQSYKNGTDVKAWLCRIVRNAALDELRKGQRKPTSVLEIDIQDKQHIEDEVGLRIDVQTALFDLPEKQRSALLLIDSDGMNYAAAADILEVPMGTVASRVATARAAMKQALQASDKDTER